MINQSSKTFAFEPSWHPINQSSDTPSITKHKKILLMNSRTQCSPSMLSQFDYHFSINKHFDVQTSFLEQITKLLSNVQEEYCIYDYLLIGDESHTKAISNCLTIENTLLQYFRLFKDLIRSKCKVRYHLFCHDSLLIWQPIHSFGLSVQAESSSFTFRCILHNDDKPKAPSEIIMPDSQANTCYKYENHQLYALSYESVIDKLDIENVPIEIKQNATYLLTGKGAIAKQLAKWLIDNFASKIIMIGHSSPSQDELETMQTLGISEYIEIDTSNRDQLQQAWRFCVKKYGEIKGIFHLAGRTHDKLLLNKTEKEFIEVLKPKVHFITHLDEVSRSSKLDFVVLFSSLTATIGNVGQSDYAAANGFLSAFTQHRNNQVFCGSRFGRTYCFDWGLWQDGGMTIDISRSDLRAIPSDKAFKLMWSAMAAKQHHCIIYNATRDLLEAGHHENTSIPQVSSDISNADLMMQAHRWLREVFLSFTKLNKLSDEDSVIEFGADSIAMINIASKLEKQLREYDDSCKIHKTILFEYPSIESLSTYLIDHYSEILVQLFTRSRMKDSMPSLRSDQGKVAYNADLNSTNQDSSASSSRLNTKASNTTRSEDIAIIGVACRLPKADNLDELWQHLSSASNCIEVIPQDRWDWRHTYDPDTNLVSKSYGRHGGFLSSIREFDAAFFNITPNDAIKMDPQERLLLQATYHALEDAGLANERSKNIGLFTSVMYGHYHYFGDDEEVIDSSFAAISNRVSYYYDFQGPSISLDTMCSGGLTAMHLACNSLKLRECETAIVAGVNLMSHPAKYRMLSQGRFLSSSGKCSSFGSDADGYVPGEGIIAVVIKPIDKALADGDTIYALVKGSAINSGGRSSAFTVPVASQQSKVISQALQNASIQPDDISYIEAHGTGTKIGDPIEIKGLVDAFKTNRRAFCSIGSIKSNIGHLESAAGLAGVCKVIKQFQEGYIAPTINCDESNPLIDFDETPFQLNYQLKEWSTTGNETRKAGVSAFGAGGSNAHLILEEFAQPKSNDTTPNWSIYLLPISAKNTASLKQKLIDLRSWVTGKDDLDLYSLACELSVYREHFRYRLLIEVNSISALLDEIQKLLNRDEWKGFRAGPIREASDSLAPTNKMIKSTRQDDLLVNLYNSVSDLYLKGYDVNWNELYLIRSRIDIPKYPFDKAQFWADHITSSYYRKPPENKVQDRVQANNIHYLVSDWIEARLPETSNKDTARKKYALLRSQNILQLNEVGADHFSFVEYDAIFTDFSSLVSNRDTVSLAIDLNALPMKLNESLLLKFVDLMRVLIQLKTECRLTIGYQKNETIEDAYISGIIGLFRTITIEHTTINVKVVCFDQVLSVNESSSRLLIEADSLTHSFLSVYYHNNTRFVENINENTLPSATGDSLLKKMGVYVITGGMGKIGQALAEYLLTEYSAVVILIGSSDLNEEKSKFLERMSAIKQSQVYYEKSDICNAEEIKRCLTHCHHHYGELNGVFHSAGRIRDGLFSQKSTSEFLEVLRVKTDGAVNIDEATKNYKLDFMLLFSSIASLYGNAGQSDYACGNAFLDEFSRIRNRQVKDGIRSGLTLSLNWPLWRDGGMAISNEQIEYMSSHHGIEPISNHEGLEVVERVLSGQGTTPLSSQLAIVKGNIESILQFTTSKQLTEQAQIVVETTLSDKYITIRQSIFDIVSDITGIELNKIDSDVSFGELGFDSVSLQKFTDKIQIRFSISIPPSAFFTFNNINVLVSHIEEKASEPQIFNAYGDKKTSSPSALDTQHIKRMNNIAMSSSTIDEQQSSTASRSEESSSLSTPSRLDKPTNGRQSHKRTYDIIGMQGLMPGANDLETYWQNLLTGQNVIQPVLRWKNRQYLGGIIDNIETFDAKFFGISAREAMLMDPQHRKFLQLAYNTFQDAGYNPKEIDNVGVFVGLQFNDYQVLLQQWKQSRHPYAATGNAHAMLANRVSYLLDFHGPSETIDTACSSALVALHRAMSALSNNECDYALVGAVSLLIDPEVTDAAKSMGVLSPNFRCATFDADADGYVRGEGVGCVLLRRHEDVVRNNQYSYGEILSSAVNHGGRANSLTAPNPNAQTALLNKAYPDRDIASQVSYVETHGTGTKLGDPIEVDALKSAWHNFELMNQTSSVLIGSVKSNIGHLEPAAGIASMLKVLLCYKYKKIPANLNFNKLNPFIDLTSCPFKIASEPMDWTDSDRVAGVSSFGFGGTNAHVVMREGRTVDILSKNIKPYYLICLSAASLRSLKFLMNALAECLSSEVSNARYSLANIAYTLNVGREHLQYRIAFVVESVTDLRTKIIRTNISDLRPCNNKSDTPVQFTAKPTDISYKQALKILADAYLEGALIDWELLHKDESQHRLQLPTYPFDEEQYWFENAADTQLMREVENA